MNKFTRSALALPFFTSAVFGAGFQLQEVSTTGLGRAFSAEASIGDDASILGSNPAGMLLLDGTSFSGGISYIRPGADVTGTFTPAAGPGAGLALPTRSDDVGDEVFVPALYVSHKLNDKLAIGFGSFTTYGLATNYETSFLGLGVADKSSLRSVNFQPSIAYRINDQFSIGAGFNVLYAEGEISSRVPNTGALAADLKGYDTGYGWNLGVLFEPSDTTRFGLHFRSQVALTLDGRTNFPLLGVARGDTTLSVTLPETLQFSAYHELNDQWAIHGDVKWTRWSRYEGLRPQVIGNPVATGALAAPTSWDDALRFSIGATYKYSDKLTLRAGVAHDESPVSNDERTLRIPDEDRFWITAGLSYKLQDNLQLDFGYARIFIDDAVITDGNATGTFNGEASGDVDIVSIGLSGSF